MSAAIDQFMTVEAFQRLPLRGKRWYLCVGRSGKRCHLVENLGELPLGWAHAYNYGLSVALVGMREASRDSCSRVIRTLCVVQTCIMYARSICQAVAFPKTFGTLRPISL
jgi:hypothetical protein